MKEKKHEQHSKKPKVSLLEERVRMDGETYLWEGDDEVNDDLRWSRVSKTRCLRDGKEVNFVKKKKREEISDFVARSEGEEIEWEDVLVRLKDPRVIKKLNHLRGRAQYRKERREERDEDEKIQKAEEEEQKQEILTLDARKQILTVGSKRYRWETMNWRRLDYEYDDDWYRVHRDGTEEKVEGIEQELEQLREDAERQQVRAAGGRQESDSGSDDKKKKYPAGDAASKVVKRDKHGVKLYSYGGKYYFTIAVNKSTKFVGHASVRLMVAGGWKTYTLDAANMKAFREEVARGGN
jgi:hypothetical protein